MRGNGLVPDAVEVINRDWRAFASLQRLVNHWDRPDWRPGRVGYYWYVTFPSSDELRQLVAECQTAFAADPSFDLVPLSDLHITLDRVVFEDEAQPGQLDAVCHAARYAAARLRPTAIEIGPLAGSSGAISFTVTPFDAIDVVRQAFTRATNVAGLGKATKRFRPHIGIAYSNAERPAEPVVAAVEALRRSQLVPAWVESVELVRLTRHEQAYDWTIHESFPLGCPTQS